MRLIDADELLKWISGQSKSPSCPKNESAFGLRIMKHIDRMPSAQPEIVRCKDCKYQEKFFHEDKRRKEGGYYIFGCELADEYSHVCLDDEFCSRAERRTEEEAETCHS